MPNFMDMFKLLLSVVNPPSSDWSRLTMTFAIKSKTLSVVPKHHLAQLHREKLNGMGCFTLMLMMKYGRILGWMTSI
jgi:hypothetical protein